MKGYPIPLPTGMPLPTWAVKLAEYLKILERQIEAPAPRAIQLEHRKVNAKAVQDGVIMWCPVTETVIVSKGGEWFPVTLGAAAPIVGIKDNG